MTYTFTLYVKDEETHEQIYAEYHNFRKVEDGYIYYRGGSNHPLEIALTDRAALNTMSDLIDTGWNCGNPKIITVHASPYQCPTTMK